jgi:hypothetical protein
MTLPVVVGKPRRLLASIPVVVPLGRDVTAGPLELDRVRDNVDDSTPREPDAVADRHLRTGRDRGAARPAEDARGRDEGMEEPGTAGLSLTLATGAVA